MGLSVLAVGLVVAVTGIYRDFAEDMAPPGAVEVYSLKALARAMRLNYGTFLFFFMPRVDDFAGFSRPY